MKFYSNLFEKKFIKLPDIEVLLSRKRKRSSESKVGFWMLLRGDVMETSVVLLEGVSASFISQRSHKGT